MTTPHTSGAADLPEAMDAIADSQYLAGVTAGWNAAQANDPNAALRKIHESRAGYLKPLRDAQLAALAAGQAVAPTEPTSDELRAIAREARNSSGSASDDCGSAAYVLYGWRAAMSKVAPPAMGGGEDAERWRAFIKSARIRFFGWAGAERDGSKQENNCYGNANGNYVHFGAEFWTMHDAKTENPEVAARLLTTYADAARAAQKEDGKS